MTSAKGAALQATRSDVTMLAVAPGQNEPLDGKGPKAASEPNQPPWYAIWTHSQCEQLVGDQLAAKGFELFLPRTTTWKQRAGQRRATQRPLFPGYLFVHHELDKMSYVEVIKARGVVRVLGERWDSLAPIPHEEIDAIRRVVLSGEPIETHPHLTAGDRVRIASGPLEGVTGVFVRSKPTKGLLVLSIDLLQRSVAVEVPAALVEEV
jgi:transcription antitermination factor NusG